MTNEICSREGNITPKHARMISVDAILQLDRALYIVEEGDCFRPEIRVTTPGTSTMSLQATAFVIPGDGKNGAGAPDTTVFR